MIEMGENALFVVFIIVIGAVLLLGIFGIIDAGKSELQIGQPFTVFDVDNKSKYVCRVDRKDNRLQLQCLD